ncbi:MAG: DNA-formamidopyrimidine glycosylase family protein [Pseudomonadota bacterium]
MPEGDTIHKHAAALSARLAGKPIEALHVRGRLLPEFAGAPIVSIEPRGKHLLMTVGDRAVIHLHLGINGSIRMTPAGTVPAWSFQRASLALVADGVAAVVTRAAVVELVRAAFLHAHPALQALGPDLLAPDADAQIDAIVVRARSRTRAAPNLAVADMLLDQRIACGLGNVYKSELLFLERLDPWARVGDLSDAALSQLYTRGAALLRGNLGPWRRTTTADRSRDEWIPRGRGRTFVYGRKNRPCVECGTIIQSRRQGGSALPFGRRAVDEERMTYFCPQCQRGTTG